MTDDEKRSVWALANYAERRGYIVEQVEADTIWISDVDDPMTWYGYTYDNFMMFIQPIRKYING